VENKQLLASISSHAYNKDQTMVAVAPNNDQVYIYATGGATQKDTSKWVQKYVLLEHGGHVSGIDWSPVTNLIVTCGHDRNAYVWKFEEKDDVWKPTLVILRINRAATAVKWSPAGNKFAVASGAKCIPVCHFEESNDWWISKMIKKNIKSTVLSLSWCVNNKFIISGSSDFKCRVYSAYIEGIDAAEDDGFGDVFPKQHEFGEILAEFDIAKSWVNTVAWAPSGFRIAFAGQNSTIHFVQILAGSEPIVQSVAWKGLPFLDMTFLTDNTIVAVGFDMNPTLFTVVGGEDSDPKWGFQETLDKEVKEGDKKEEKKDEKSSISKSRDMFQKQASQGISSTDKKKESSAKAAVTIPTRHTNIINSLWCLRADRITKFSTSSLDGRVLFWDLDKLKVELK